MFKKIIGITLAALMLGTGLGVAGSPLTIPGVGKSLAINAFSQKTGCNPLIGNRCETSSLIANWECTYVNKARSCAGSLRKTYYLNDDLTVVFHEPLTPDQVTYDRHTHRLTIASEELGGVVTFSQIFSFENKRETFASRIDAPAFIPYGESCEWETHILGSGRTLTLKATMEGFTHDIEGHQMKEGITIITKKERFL